MESPTLANWVGDIESFSSHQWQHQPAVFTPETLASPFDLDELDVAFDSGLLRTPYLEMVRSNKVTVPTDAYTTSRVVNGTTHHGFADRAKVVGLMRAGATLLLRHVDQWHRPTADLVARLSGELDRRVEAFFFVTPADAQGLATHRDDADVFALQVAGRKTWYVHSAPKTADWPLGELPDDEDSPQLLRGVLEPGNVLYIPRGFAHRAVGEAGLSAHLSLTIRDISLPDLAAALQQCLTENLDIPARPLGKAAIKDACATLLGHARAQLATITPDDLRHAARAAQTQQPGGEPARPETFTATAEDWDSDTPGTKRPGLASVARTWHRLRDAARGTP
ncbi:JmjC domain-containing protein [Streptomyces sp. NPDC048445]|uniref:JmjC domain-containing protein n=1 Tax=Streptomyces sp. NPDC048445 TaxID=3365553 RepID=UPI00371303EF